MKILPNDVEKIDLVEEMPQGVERRLVLRLLGHWRKLCGDREFPCFSDLDPAEIPDIWLNSFVIELSGDRAVPVFRAMGDTLVENSGSSLIGRPVADAPAGTLCGVAIAYIDEVLAKEVPVSRGGEFARQDGTKVLYRSVLLPMSDDGETISGILGAANCRAVVVE
ncbi:MAG: PAS domain-containing protein [Rhodospirillaceae bacterium]|jgi:hypothetical protein|nr:PAS domain-containing protein [Rhodospirillaceae bacterium]